MLINVSIISTNRIQELIKKQIINQGYVVNCTFSDYGTALKEYKKDTPEIIIVDSDIHIGGVTFKKFLYELFYLDVRPEVIILSEYIEYEFQQELMSLGLKYYIEKPFQPARIWECIDDILINTNNRNKNIVNYSLVESILNGQACDDAILSKKDLLSKQINSVRNQINNKKHSNESYNTVNTDFEIILDDYNDDYNKESFTIDQKTNKSIYNNQNNPYTYLQSNTNANSDILLEGNKNLDNLDKDTDVTLSKEENGYLGLPKYIKKDDSHDVYEHSNIKDKDHIEEINKDNQEESNISIKNKLKNFLLNRQKGDK